MQPYYDDGQITLYCGDCREVLPTLADQSADLVLTDPPYGVDFQYDGPYQDTEQGYREWLQPVVGEIRRVGKVAMLTTGINNLWLYPPPTWVMCWAKPGSPRRSRLGGFCAWEPVLVYGKTTIYNDFKWLPAAVNITKGPAAAHPCPKPIALCRWLVAEGSKPGELVLDPFAGSGSTLRAAKDLGRRAIGVEINPAYCEIIVERLAQQVLPLAI